MNRTIRAVSRAKAAKSRISSSFVPRSSTTFTFNGDKPTDSATSMASSTVRRSPRRRIDSNRSARNESQLTLTRVSPALASDEACRASSILAHEGLATGEAERRNAEIAGHAGHADNLVEIEKFRPGKKRHPFFGHAVDAAQIAAVGHRDA